jgi:glycyl-tRNA synthetase
MEKLVSLCKRRGFIFQSSEIYGGIGGFWDYGPLGVELKNNIKRAWWQDMIQNPPAGPDGREIQMVGLDCSIIMNPKVWEASGHASGFADPMVDDKDTQQRFRADQLQGIYFLPPAPEMTPGENYLVTSPPPNEAIPDQTVVATSPSEALSMLLTDKVLRKLCGIRDILSAHPFMGTAIRNLDIATYATLWVTTAKGSQYAYARTCPVSLLEAAHERIPSPFTGKCGALTEPRAFNLMNKTFIGAMEDGSTQAWLRPETAQGIFCNYKNVVDTSRVKIPFGIGQVGKAFRNEINPRNFTFRSREFEQMEMEFFCRDEDSMRWYEFWRNYRFDWYTRHGLKSEKLRLRDQQQDELAHYSRACADIEYLFPFSDEHQELEGVAHRGCFDLTQHQTHSGVDLNYFDEAAWAAFLADRKARGEPELTKEQKAELGGKPPYRFLPTVIEPSAGADRATLAFLCEAYTEDQKPDAKGVMQTRVLMRFHPRLAPIKAAFLPLVNKEGMDDLAYQLYREAKKHMNVFYDDGGAIGRRYARMDEAGTPFCITIDGDTIKSEGENAGMVTIRDRDTLEQTRVRADQSSAWLQERVWRA